MLKTETGRGTRGTDKAAISEMESITPAREAEHIKDNAREGGWTSVQNREYAARE
jgi:hypothetical protein